MKSKKGITLIALIITIIVLLLLAGISISMLSGQDGILNKATTAKTKSKESEILEKVNLSVLSAVTKAEGRINEEIILEELKGEFGENSEIVKEYEESKTITIGDNKYEISSNGSVEQYSLANKLNLGDYVEYKFTNESGEEKRFVCIVSAKDDKNRVQVIPTTTVGTINIGSNDFEEAKQIGANIKQILQQEAQKYLNTELATSIKCVENTNEINTITQEKYGEVVRNFGWHGAIAAHEIDIYGPYGRLICIIANAGPTSYQWMLMNSGGNLYIAAGDMGIGENSSSVLTCNFLPIITLDSNLSIKETKNDETLGVDYYVLGK